MCGTYYTDLLSREASSDMLGAMEGAEVEWGVKLESYGQKLVLTLPKATSAWLAEEKVSDGEGISKLYQAGREFVKAWWGKGVGGVMGMDFAGESEPTVPHYHLNVYISPLRLIGGGFKCKRVSKPRPVSKVAGGWSPVDKWVQGEDFVKLRRSWAAILRRTFACEERWNGAYPPGLGDLEEGVLWVKYLDEPKKLRHWLRYLYRSPLFDLWKGWQGRQDDGDLDYSYKVKGGGRREVVLGWEAVGNAVGRVAYLPRHWERIRWFGCWSDGQKKANMESLGLRGRDLESDDDDEDEETWTPSGESFRLVSMSKEGIVLRNTKTDEVVKVPNDKVCWSPKGVDLGKRRRWSRPR